MAKSGRFKITFEEDLNHERGRQSNIQEIGHSWESKSRQGQA